MITYASASVTHYTIEKCSTCGATAVPALVGAASVFAGEQWACEPARQEEMMVVASRTVEPLSCDWRNFGTTTHLRIMRTT